MSFRAVDLKDEGSQLVYLSFTHGIYALYGKPHGGSKHNSKNFIQPEMPNSRQKW